ncbi:VIT1/CCC1 transporter family protein [Roseivivax sediminis]|uniref:VIT family protein n=1 Tax=Roseivivax sediminis TaxID=936889 RepID=A0A1I1VPI7_9RHOB|nr:VIT1/CCC1 transporter family protein [Roseivivax sediminis]SFD84937.1 VIT family protein [Roseivivax sediminis]
MKDRSPERVPRTAGLRETVGKYLPDLILGANDGIITTLAVVSSVEGADLSVRVILILGFANLVADGLSMGASNILSRRSRVGEGALPSITRAGRYGAATFLGFVIFGLVPLLAYLLPGVGIDRFLLATGLALTTLFLVGAGRAIFTGRNWLMSGAEMLILGTLAAGAAYGIGMLGAAFTGSL